MKKMVVWVVFFFALCTGIKAQENSYPYIDRIALSIPAAQTNSTTDIANYILQHFKTDEEKVRAIYIWIINNINYSTDSIHRVILNEDREQKIIFALRRKKGICENFAAIFNDICIKSGIPSYLIEGNTQQIATIDKAPHVWCSAKINGNWFLYDPTWDATLNNKIWFNTSLMYFQMSPSLFIKTHLPYDPMLQFMDHPFSYAEFIKGKTETSNNKSYFNYKDSLAAFEQMDSLTQYKTTLSRIRRNDFPKARTDAKIKQLLLEIELINQDNDMFCYHGAISDYNNAIGILNEWIVYRNQMFKGPIRESDTGKIFNRLDALIVAANLKLKTVNNSTATLKLNTEDLSQKLTILAQSSKDQKSYFKNYVNASKNP